MLLPKCKLHKSRALPAWFTGEGLGYSRHSLTLEVVLEWLVKKALCLAVPGPIAYLLAWAQGPGLGQRGLSLGLAGFSLCWADFPLFLSRICRSTSSREI